MKISDGFLNFIAILSKALGFFLGIFPYLDSPFDEEDEEERDDELPKSLSLLDEDEFTYILGVFFDINRKFAKLI